MEFEYNDRNEIEDIGTRVDSILPSDATYYPIMQVADDISILPLNNLIINDDVKIAYYQLINIFGTKIYNPSHTMNGKMRELNPELQQLFDKFKSNAPLTPIEVREEVPINNPSPNYPNVPSVAGQGAPMVQYPLLTDYLYQSINGDNKIAMSIFFDYNYIPVVTRV